MAASAVSSHGTVQTINPDPEWVDPTPVEHASQLASYEPFRASRLLGTGEIPDMVILMEEGLCQAVGIDLMQQWMDDIEAEEYSVQLVEVSYGTPEEFRALLDSLHSQGLEGALLVGDLPAAWVAVWDTEAGMGEQLPCDYFLMDLDGEWIDEWIGYPRDSVPGQDGFYDTIKGAVAPEIWLGRIRVDNLPGVGEPVALLQAYLERNHLWRVTGDPEPVRALCYVDDDWQESGEVYRSAMELLYEDVELFNRSVETCERDYELTRLPDSYSWVSPFVHSNPNNHFWQPDGGITNWSEIAPIAPPARFYNLFACSNCRFTTTNNMGSIYSIGADQGLAAVGSTCSGAMLWFTYFYGPLGGGGTLGEAFKLWWEYIALNGFSQHELNWHIGMVLLGDPTLVPAMHLTGVEGPGYPRELALSVSPNPCAGIATAAFELPVSCDVDLTAYDLAGRVVWRVSEKDLGPGSHSLGIDELSPGVYFVRMRAGETVVSRRFVVIE